MPFGLQSAARELEVAHDVGLANESPYASQSDLINWRGPAEDLSITEGHHIERLGPVAGVRVPFPALARAVFDVSGAPACHDASVVGGRDGRWRNLKEVNSRKGALDPGRRPTLALVHSCPILPILAHRRAQYW
ncbi:MAG TPA: hypothetical protein PK020_08670 [Ilumatobacteraceae bacterium]|nr:hypothetical protein [Ilumatobacteraceae bacterium]HRB04625.1 hypothetical protein [Ilumatobacteraceae bacterium]